MNKLTELKTRLQKFDEGISREVFLDESLKRIGHRAFQCAKDLANSDKDEAYIESGVLLLAEIVEACGQVIAIVT
jgi:hypothetical protein